MYELIRTSKRVRFSNCQNNSLPQKLARVLLNDFKNIVQEPAAIQMDKRKLLNRDITVAEALPKMAKKASSEDLRQAFEEHLEQTRTQVTRVEKAFAETGKSARAKTCEAMKGLIKHKLNRPVFVA